MASSRVLSVIWLVCKRRPDSVITLHLIPPGTTGAQEAGWQRQAGPSDPGLVGLILLRHPPEIPALTLQGGRSGYGARHPLSSLPTEHRYGEQQSLVQESSLTSELQPILEAQTHIFQQSWNSTLWQVLMSAICQTVGGRINSLVNRLLNKSSSCLGCKETVGVQWTKRGGSCIWKEIL